MMEKVKEEKALMKEIYDKDIIANKKIASEKDYKPKLNIDLSLWTRYHRKRFKAFAK